MTNKALSYIANKLDSLQIEYEFMQWNGKEIPQAYWVGEYSEQTSVFEDGEQDSTFILTGTSRNWKVLEDTKAIIKEVFPPIGGDIASFEDGSKLAIFYENAYPVPTGNAELKRLQINLLFKEWSV